MFSSIIYIVTTQKGGIASGFKKVTINSKDTKCLYHVKGRRIARAVEVDISWKSFNRGDIFILQLGTVSY